MREFLTATTAALVCLSASATPPSEVVLRARAEVQALEARSPRATVVWPRDRALPTVLAGLDEPARGPTAEARARGFLERHAALVGLTPAQLELREAREGAARSTVSYRQVHDGLPVEGRGLTVTLEGDRVVGLVNDSARISSVARATISPERARALAVEAVFGPGASALAAAGPAVRALAVVGEHGTEIYKVAVLRRPLVEQLEVRVDAHAGRVIGVADRTVR